MAEENDALKAQAKKDKEKIEKLEKEMELTNDLDVSLSMKLLLDSGIEESKMGKLSKKKQPVLDRALPLLIIFYRFTTYSRGK